MSFEKIKKLPKIIPLATLAITVQPPMHPNQEATKPAGVREALRKLDGQNGSINLPDGRAALIDGVSPKRKEEGTQESAEA